MPATSDALEDRVRTLIQDTPSLTAVVIDLEGVNFIDSQGSAKLGDILVLCEQADVAPRLARVKPGVRASPLPYFLFIWFVFIVVPQPLARRAIADSQANHSKKKSSKKR